MKTPTSSTEVYKALGPVFRYNTEFGKGIRATVTSEYNDMTPYGQALVQAWIAGCPIPDEVIGVKYPADEARDRYLDISDAFTKVILDEIPLPLLRQIKRPEERLPHEKKNLSYDPHRVPGQHLDQIAPLSHIKGHATARIAIEQMGGSQERTQERTAKLSPALKNAAKHAQCPLEFAVKLSEEVIQLDADPNRVLHNLFSLGNLKEEQTHTAFDAMAEMAFDVAPNLMECYEKLTAEDKKKLGIVHFRHKRTPDFKTFRRLTCRPD